METVARRLAPILQRILGTDDPPVAIQAWDGSVLGHRDSETRILLRTPDALRRILYSPGELGFARAYVAGELDVEGSIFDLLDLRDLIAGQEADVSLRLDRSGRLRLLRAGRSLRVLGRPLSPPPEEAHLKGVRHSIRRDARAVSHHYDVSNDFYRMILGGSMTYSCAYWSRPGMSLEEAQEAKYELIATKLGLTPGMKLLDVGCGWGGMAIHAARHHGVNVLGITVSSEQAELAAKRVAEAGVADHAEIRLQNYREIQAGPFDAISSIGMFEHVGLSQLGRYFDRLHSLLRPEGRLLNHAISRPAARKSGFEKDSFIARYVFPDGELHEVGAVVSAMQEHGLEVRDVHSLREHYAQTLRRWVDNLEANWDAAVSHVGAPRARVWRLYLAGSAVNFEANRISVHQVLGVKSSANGRSGMPLDRRA